MSDQTDAYSELVAHQRIRDCIAALARGEDRRDAAIIARCFWTDAKVDFGVFAGSFDDYLAWVVPGSPSIPVTLHTLGQSVIDLRGGAAAVETHVTAYHRIDFGPAEHDAFLGGRYLDQMEQRDGEWRIATRTMLYDWSRDLGVSTDWSQGLMGMPFLQGNAVGSANGDPSEAFFK
ncbi:MAG: nuclear transport factor 2 family protein [Sphingomicrobium sp.]